MAAPDTSFHPLPPREERHPGLGPREHPVSQAQGDEWSEEGYLDDIRRLAIVAERAHRPGLRDTARA